MPPDRAFGKGKKLLRRRETILMPCEYFEVFSEVGNVLRCGEDWKVYDFKAMAKTVVKNQPGFRIIDAKVVEVVPESSLMTVRNFYASTGCQHSILKRGSRLSSLVAKKLPPTDTVKTLKKRDVLQLLQAMGQNEVTQVIDFYRSVCKENENNDESDNDEDIVSRNKNNW